MNLVTVMTQKAATCSVEAWRVIIREELPHYAEGQISELVAFLDGKITSLEHEAHERLKNARPHQEQTNLARDFRAKRREVFAWYHENNLVPPWRRECK